LFDHHYEEAQGVLLTARTLDVEAH
jgi:hypothetical protein